MKTKKQYSIGEVFLLKQQLINGTRATKRIAYRTLKKLGFTIEKTTEPSVILKNVYKIIEKQEVSIKQSKKKK